MKIKPLDVDHYIETRICRLLETDFISFNGFYEKVNEYFCATFIKIENEKEGEREK